MLASYYGHGAVVRLLLERGAAPDEANDLGQTPLAGAAFKGDGAIVALLLDHGARVDAEDPQGRTPLMFAAMFDRADIVGLLLARGAAAERADGGGERQRGGSAGDEQRPETGCTARAGETDEERADRHPRSERDGEGAIACFRSGGPIVVAADQGNRSDGYDDAREAQRTWPLSEPDRDENGDGDRADCGDRGDHAHPAYPEPVI